MDSMLLVPIVAWILMTGLLLRIGRAQRRQVGASARSFVLRSSLLAMVVVLPVLPPCLLGGKIGAASRLAQTIGPDGEVLEVELPSHAAGFDWIVTLLAVVLALRIVSLGLWPIGRALGAEGALPELPEPEAGRVRGIAERLGITPPRALLLRTAGPRLVANAVAGGLLGPVIVVTDGALHRLSGPDLDAVIAHEMAHVARRSVARYIAILALVAMLVVLTSWRVSWTTAAVMLVTLPVLAIVRTGQSEEPACDLLGARAVGHARMAGALDKIHVMNRLTGRPWLRAFLHAMLSHPALDVRAARLRDAAPLAERDAIAVDEREVARCRTAVHWVVALQGVLIAGGIAADLRLGQHWLGPLLLVSLFLLPSGLFAWALWDEIWAAWRFRLPSSRHVGPLLPPLLLAAGVLVAALIGLASGSPLLAGALGLVAVVLLGWSALGARPLRRALRRIESAVRDGDFEEVVRILGSLPPRLARRPVVGLWRALAVGRTRGLDAAIRELERLVGERPRLHAARLWLATLGARARASQAVEHAEELARRLPRNVHALGLVAYAYRSLGQPRAAREALAGAQRLDRRDRFAALEALIALDLGEADEARAAIARAEALEPGDAHVLVAKLEVLLGLGEEQEAHVLLDDVRRAVGATPLVFLEPRLEALEARLAATGAPNV